MQSSPCARGTGCYSRCRATRVSIFNRKMHIHFRHSFARLASDFLSGRGSLFPKQSAKVRHTPKPGQCFAILSDYENITRHLPGSCRKPPPSSKTTAVQPNTNNSPVYIQYGEKKGEFLSTRFGPSMAFISHTKKSPVNKRGMQKALMSVSGTLPMQSQIGEQQGRFDSPPLHHQLSFLNKSGVSEKSGLPKGSFRADRRVVFSGGRNFSVMSGKRESQSVVHRAPRVKRTAMQDNYEIVEGIQQAKDAERLQITDSYTRKKSGYEMLRSEAASNTSTRAALRKEYSRIHRKDSILHHEPRVESTTAAASLSDSETAETQHTENSPLSAVNRSAEIAENSDNLENLENLENLDNSENVGTKARKRRKGSNGEGISFPAASLGSMSDVTATDDDSEVEENVKEVVSKKKTKTVKKKSSKATTVGKGAFEDDIAQVSADVSSSKAQEENPPEVKVEPLMPEPPKDVALISTVEQAEWAMQRLRELARDEDRIFACDTEVMAIDIKKESPCGHGIVICFSVYCGEDANFGESDDGVVKTHLWVDTMPDGVSDRHLQVFEAFREFFKDNESAYKKVWHNYGFDRHVVENPPFEMDCSSFSGDTMHMARLWDSSRKIKGYSLEALSTDPEIMGELVDDSAKTSMKTIFGYKKRPESKMVTLDPIENLQTDERTRNMWIHYSARDAKATYNLRQELKARLKKNRCLMDESLKPGYGDVKTQWNLYEKVWLPFGELLTDMEKEGFYVDTEHLSDAQKEAESDRSAAAQRFRSWAASRGLKDAVHINVNSDPQIRTMLFAGLPNARSKEEKVEMERVFQAPNPEYEEFIQEGKTGKKPRKNMAILVHSAWGQDVTSKLTPQIYTDKGWPAVSTPALRSLVGKPGAARKLLEEKFGLKEGHDNTDLLDEGGGEGQEVATPDLSPNFCQNYKDNLAAEKVKEDYGIGSLYAPFGGGKEGLLACVAVESLLEVSAIDTLLSNFIEPLQADNIKTPNGRIHASLNINTETGRLSCRRPNLQNQPALEKDRYKVRKAFMADRRDGKKNTLVVADYGQLELRVLAHLTNCKSMLDAFETGGDFHSRTALGMYDHIKEAVQEGDALLEWDGGESGHEPPPVPLLKDKFGAERRKAKVLNFSIAYGKTAHGLSKDWKVSMKEAEETVNRWYADRREVKTWQEETIQKAKNRNDGHYVTTLLGRRRNLPDIVSKKWKNRSHAERAAINTPIQGSAADIATAAMLCIANNKELKELGWKLLLQVHDEVILEGPEESAELAKKIVVDCMEHPFPAPGGGYHNPLRCALLVDCNIAHTWYDAK